MSDVTMKPSTLVGGLFCLLLIGCSSQSIDEIKTVRHEQARGLLEKRHFTEALAAYQQLVKLDPQDDEAYYQMARLHLQSGKAEDVSLAHQALLKVIKLKPSRIDAQLDLARLYLLGGQPARARLYVDGVLATQPMHPEAHLLRGQSLVREDRPTEGMAEFRKVIEEDPTRALGFLDLADAHAKRQDYVAAEAVLREGLQANPRSIEIRMALGGLLESMSEASKAADEYRAGIAVIPNSGALYFKLATLMERQQRVGEAEAVYRRWIDALPDDVQGHVALAHFYRSMGRMKEALTSYQLAKQVDSSSQIAREALITFYLDTGRLEEAGHETDALLKDNPNDPGGRTLQARLRIEQGAAGEAVPLLQELIREVPRSATVHQYLGIAWAQLRQLPQALSELKEARALDPQSSDIHTTLAQVYLAQGSLSLAIQEGQEALRSSPHNMAAVRVLGEAQLLAGDTKQAQQLFKALVSVLPHDPLLHHRLGIISRAQQHPAEAITHFEQALERDPQFMDAIEHIAAILVSEGKVRQARERVSRQISTAPKNALLYDLLGRLWAVSHNFMEAEAAFRTALSLDGTALPPYANLGELYTRQGKISQAIKEFETMLAKNPQQVSTLMILGILHEQRNDFARAATRYEEALKLQPKFAPAANNLAWILIDQGGDKERALLYAETARAAMPRDPRIADTLGWIYYHKQMYQKSSSLLKEAVDQFPDQPVILYHYGMAQYGNKNADEAQKSLNKFLALSPSDPNAHKAKEVLAALAEERI